MKVFTIIYGYWSPFSDFQPGLLGLLTHTHVGEYSELSGIQLSIVIGSFCSPEHGQPFWTPASYSLSLRNPFSNFTYVLHRFCSFRELWNNMFTHCKAQRMCSCKLIRFFQKNQHKLKKSVIQIEFINGNCHETANLTGHEWEANKKNAVSFLVFKI